MREIEIAWWELLVLWITWGAFIGTSVGWAFGAVRWGVIIGVVSAVVMGLLAEAIQWWKSRRLGDSECQ